MPLTDKEIKERADRLRAIFYDIDAESAARICLRAGYVRADDRDLAALAKLKLLEDLTKDSPDPRNLKLASELGIEARNEEEFTMTSISIVPYRVADTSLAQIIAEVDNEEILIAMIDALTARLDELRVYSPAIVQALKRHKEGLARIFGAVR